MMLESNDLNSLKKLLRNKKYVGLISSNYIFLDLYNNLKIWSDFKSYEHSENDLEKQIMFVLEIQ